MRSSKNAARTDLDLSTEDQNNEVSGFQEGKIIRFMGIKVRADIEEC